MATSLVISNNGGDPTVQFDGNAATGMFGYNGRAGAVTLNNLVGRPAIYLNGRDASLTLGGADGYAGSLVINDKQANPVVRFDSANGDFIFGNSAHWGSFVFTNGTIVTCKIDNSSLTLGATGSPGFFTVNAMDGTNALTIDGTHGTLNFFSPLTPNTPSLKISGTGIVAGAATWPDFVFEEDYNLKTIEELKSFTKQNKKLPDLPNAQEVRTQGFDLIETQRVLLQKIEELTCYVFQLHDRISELEKGNSN